MYTLNTLVNLIAYLFAKDEVEKAKQGMDHFQAQADFGKKRDTILRRLGFVMDAVQTIAEAGRLILLAII